MYCPLSTVNGILGQASFSKTASSISGPVKGSPVLPSPPSSPISGTPPPPLANLAPQPIAGSPPFLLDTASIQAAPSRAECVSPLTALSDVSDLTTLVSGLTACGLSSELSFSSWAGTILAPSNTAFTAFAQGAGLTQAQLLQDTNTLCPIVRNHILPGEALTASQLTLNSAYETLNTGQTLTVTGNPAEAIILRDIPGCNAYAHELDIVLVQTDTQVTTNTAQSPPTPQAITQEAVSTTADSGATVDVTKVEVSGTVGSKSPGRRRKF